MTPYAPTPRSFFPHALRVVLACLAFLFVTQIARAEIIAVSGHKRIALVVGNTNYQYVEKLVNPANDSQAISAALRDEGFDVFPANDTTRDEFDRIFNEFKTQAETADVALVYFSGHGFQLNGVNYLVPVDARLNDRSRILDETISLDKVIGEIQQRTRQTLVFLDACRNNPLPDGGSVNAGLAQVTAGAGVYVAFATQPGNISYDGKSSYSPFTKALVDHIKTPGLSISDLMIKVRNDVKVATLDKQIPWEQSSLQQQFYFSEPSGGIKGEGQQQVAALDQSGSQADQGLTRRTDLGDATRAPAANLTPDPGYPSAINPQTGMNPIIIMPEAPVEIFGQEDFVFTLQNELQRVGCYTSDPDGVWGGSSREAAQRYWATKKMKTADTGPTQFLYENVKREPSSVCVYEPPRQAVAPAKPGPRIPVKPRAARVVADSDPEPQRVFKPVEPAAPPKKSLRGSLIGGVYR
ncbi:caspase domain-containing protein [Phyllobacterium sp. TAF24]|uniref:caspase family protein n=1 Tax=Phyllobacterium sp. TAF24 TaxID=3233068 RepID=UPI003F97F88F